MACNLAGFTSSLVCNVKAIHWLLLAEGSLNGQGIVDAWPRKSSEELNLPRLGLLNPTEIVKLLNQFPEAFATDAHKNFTARKPSASSAFSPKNEKVVEFLFDRYREWCTNNSVNTRDRDEDRGNEPEAKKAKTESPPVSASPSVSDGSDIDPDEKKELLVVGAKVIYDGCREGVISSAFPYLNQYWIKDEAGMEVVDETDGTSDIPQNKTFRMEDLRLPDVESWECERLPDAVLEKGGLCQVRALHDDSAAPWLDATILEVYASEEDGRPIYRVRIHKTPLASKLGYADRIGSNVPEAYVRWVPNRHKAAQNISLFVELEKQAMERDRTYDCDAAISLYGSAGVKLAEAEQNLSRTDEDYHHIKNHRLEIVRRVRYLKKTLKSGSHGGADEALENYINTVQLSPSLHQLIRQLQLMPQPPPLPQF